MIGRVRLTSITVDIARPVARLEHLGELQSGLALFVNGAPVGANVVGVAVVLVREVAERLRTPKGSWVFLGERDGRHQGGQRQQKSNPKHVV